MSRQKPSTGTEKVWESGLVEPSYNLVFYDTLKYNAQRSWVLGLTWLPLYDIAPAPENAGGGQKCSGPLPHVCIEEMRAEELYTDHRGRKSERG